MDEDRSTGQDRSVLVADRQTESGQSDREPMVDDATMARAERRFTRARQAWFAAQELEARRQ
jgi:hypothetical protein